MLQPVLEGSKSRGREAAGRQSMEGAGFVDEQPAKRLPDGAARAPSGPRFLPLATSTNPAPNESPRNGSGVHVAAAEFLPALVLNGSTPGRISRDDADPQWAPFPPVLPAQAPARICLVFGVLLQGHVQPARQDSLPENFQIRFQPVRFPQFSPRMGRLEERLHRTDRIGFSPP